MVTLWIKRYTEIGPGLEIKILYHTDVYGIEIQITSKSGDNINVWVVISRGSNRYVDELRYNDPEYAPESIQEPAYVSMQETDAEQSTIQSGPQCSLFDEHFHHNERKLEDLTANEFSHKYELGYHISKFVGKLAKIAMTDKQMVQFIGVRSCSMEEIASLMEIGVIISGWEAARHGFSVARSLATLYYVFVARTH